MFAAWAPARAPATWSYLFAEANRMKGLRGQRCVEQCGQWRWLISGSTGTFHHLCSHSSVHLQFYHHHIPGFFLLNCVPSAITVAIRVFFHGFDHCPSPTQSPWVTSGESSLLLPLLLCIALLYLERSSQTPQIYRNWTSTRNDRRVKIDQIFKSRERLAWIFYISINGTAISQRKYNKIKYQTSKQGGSRLLERHIYLPHDKYRALMLRNSHLLKS